MGHAFCIVCLLVVAWTKPIKGGVPITILLLLQQEFDQLRLSLQGTRMAPLPELALA